MALYRAFKAFRPEKSKQALIPALPYDVMNSEEAREAVKGNPYSFLHIDKAETVTKYIKKQKKILKILNKQAHLFKMKSLVFIFTGKL